MNKTTAICLTLLVFSPACASAGRKPAHRKVRIARKPAYLKSVPSTLVLRITAKKTRLKAKEYAKITVTIRNCGKSAVTLVQPGDGSRWAGTGCCSTTATTLPFAGGEFRSDNMIRPPCGGSRPAPRLR